MRRFISGFVWLAMLAGCSEGGTFIAPVEDYKFCAVNQEIPGDDGTNDCKEHGLTGHTCIGAKPDGTWGYCIPLVELPVKNGTCETTDAGEPDSGQQDAGSSDAGVDTGTDAGFEDAGASDAGPDMEDGGGSDAGHESDAGVDPIIITYHQAEAGEKSAMFSWETSEASFTLFRYARKSDYLADGNYRFVIQKLPVTTSHQVVIGGLDPDTEYVYQAFAEDLGGRDGVGEQQTIRTEAVFDRSSPTVGAGYEAVMVNQATINWSASEVTTTVEVKYGTTQNNLDQKRTGSSGQLAGQVVLTGLTQATRYFVQVVVSDGRNFGESQILSLTTAAPPGGDTTPPQIEISFAHATQTDAKIAWHANESVTGNLEVSGPTRQTIPVSGFGGMVSLTGLTPGATYLCALRAADNAGNFGNAPDQSFATANPSVDSTPPFLEVFTGGTTERTATIGWFANEQVTGVIRYGTSAATLDSSLSRSVTGSFGPVTLTGVTPGTTYYYKLAAEDGSGNVSESPIRQFTTPAEVVTGPAEISATVGEVSIRTPIYWFSERELANVRVEYGVNGAYNLTENGVGNATSGTIVLKGLQTNTNYSLRVVGAESSGLAGVPFLSTFATPQRITDEVVIRCKAVGCTLKIYHPSISGFAQVTNEFRMPLTVLCSSVFGQSRPEHGELFYVYTITGGQFNWQGSEIVLPDGQNTLVQYTEAVSPNSGAGTVSRTAIGCYSKFGYTP